MDDAAKRREARRRKILENSQNRLNVISGKEQKSTKSEPELCEKFVERTDIPSVSDEIIQEAPQERPQPRQPQKQYRKTVMAALAIFINLLLLLVEGFQLESSTSHMNKIFLPLLVYEVVEFFSANKPSEKKSFIYLLLAANAKSAFILPVIKHLELITSVLQDVMMYFFVFVCCEFVRYVILEVS